MFPKLPADMELVKTPKHWSTFLTNNGFCLHQCVGHGSYGDVFKVTTTTTSEVWAVKRLVTRGNISQDDTIMAEINALLLLTHPNVVSLEKVLLCPRIACIVMDFAPEGNLEMLAQRSKGDLENTFISSAFLQTVSAVQYCHSNHLAHRDINPTNILIFNKRLVKLADFGLCVPSRDVSSGKELLCTDYTGHNAYLAPEVKKMKPYAACCADVWSVGCILYFLITKSHPCDDVEIMMKQLSDLHVPLPDTVEHRQNATTRPEDTVDAFRTAEGDGLNEVPVENRIVGQTFRSGCISVVQSLCQVNCDHRATLKEVEELSLWIT